MARLLAIAFGALVLLVVVLAVVDLLRIRHDLERGKATLTGLTFATVDRDGGLVPTARAAAADLHRAADRAESSPWLSLLSHVPVVGDQVKGVRDMTADADQAGRLGLTAATDVQGALDHASTAGPAGRVPLVEAVSAASDRLQAGLREIHVGAGGWLVPPLSGARADLVRALAKADARLDEGRRTLATLRSFLSGPRRYLILGGNNAEMRSTGIATTSGVATISNGAVEVGDFLDAGRTALAKPGVPLPDGWDWLFGYLDPGIAYSNLVASPNFPLTGETAAAISSRNRFGPVDGVIYVDTVALQHLLGVVGPVTVDGVTYDGTNAARILINENYFDYPSEQERDARRGAQGRVAKAIFDALNTRDVSLVKLAAALQDLATERHLFAWSSNADEETLWQDVGADGTRRPDDLLVASEDLGASKLDYYVTEQVRMNVRPAANGRRVELSVTLTNPPRTQSSAYIDGGSIFAKPGEYGVYVVAFLPHDAFDLDNSDPSWTSWANDGPLQATTFTARVPMGTSKTINLAFTLPSTTTQLTVVPTARVVPARWTGNLGTFGDVTPTTIDLRRVPTGSTVGNAGWLVVGMLLFGCGAVLFGEQRQRFDREIGWWLLVVGVAMAAVQIAIFVLN